MIRYLLFLVPLTRVLLIIHVIWKYIVSDWVYALHEWVVSRNKPATDADINDSQDREPFRGKWREAEYRREDQENGQSSRARHNHPFSRSEPLTPRAQNLKVLGLTPIADQKAIKQAYRKLAKRHHPDRFLTQAYTDAQRTEAARKMREVNQAYDWLCSNA